MNIYLVLILRGEYIILIYKQKYKNCSMYIVARPTNTSVQTSIIIHNNIELQTYEYGDKRVKISV